MHHPSGGGEHVDLEFTWNGRDRDLLK
jgi:hypothetical protein